jgi:3-hydroxybutyryl-CoA dehydrogenase
VTEDLANVGVVGLGTMGAGIAEVFARSGLSVLAVEKDEAALAVGRGHLEGSTARAVRRGKLTEQEQRELLGRITFHTDLAELTGVDLVVEAVPERLDLKRALFARLDELCAAQTILATNTSSLPVTEIAVTTSRPEKVVGMHFFNPAPVMRLVEVVRTVVTEPEVVANVEMLACRLGKVAVTVDDRAGFIANALLFGYLNHAVSLYGSGYASREHIDTAMTIGVGLPMGPLALLDLIGLDTAQEIVEAMYRQSRDRRHAPAPVLTTMVTAGLLGRKTGRGFYTYEAPGSGVVVPDAETPPGGLVTGTPRTGNVRPVRRVGVVGSGPTVDRVVEAAATAGYQVQPVAQAADLDTQPGQLGGCDLVIEAAGGDLIATQAALAAIARAAAPGTVLGTTTSYTPVIACAAATGRPQDVLGLHPAMLVSQTPLVELVRTVSTSDDAVATARAVCERLGWTPVDCPDRAGFVVSALLFPFLNDAVTMLQARYATVDGIDAAMTLGCGYPSGPFAILDEVGLDVALAIQRAIYKESREPGLAPAPLLEHLVIAGDLGRKSGRGFRDHR